MYSGWGTGGWDKVNDNNNGWTRARHLQELTNGWTRARYLDALGNSPEKIVDGEPFERAWARYVGLLYD